MRRAFAEHTEADPREGSEDENEKKVGQANALDEFIGKKFSVAFRVGDYTLCTGVGWGQFFQAGVRPRRAIEMLFEKEGER